MTKNSHAQKFMEFVTEHNLSLYKIAKLANISEGTLRAFRDTPGRHLSAQNFFAVSNALEKLTGVKCDYFSLFHDGSLSLPPDYTFFVHPTTADRSSAIPNVGDLHASDAAEEKETDADKNKSDERQSIASNVGDVSGIPQYMPIRRVRVIRHQHDTQRHKSKLVRFQIDEKFHDLIISDEIIGKTTRPPSLMRSSDAYAIYVPDSQMWPRLEEGDLAYVDPNWPAKADDDVVIYVKSEQNGQAFLAHLISRNPKEYTFACYTADGIYMVNTDNVAAIHKILRGQELIIR